MTCAWPYRDGSSRSATVADVPMGTVDFDGIRTEVCLAYLPEAAVGDYTIVHVGFAISLVDEASAMETSPCSVSSACSMASSRGPRRRRSGAQHRR